MFGMGMPELLVILVIALLVFGTKRLPEVGSSLGKAIRGFKGAVDAEPSTRLLVAACSHCGEPHPRDAAFCSQCGQKMGPA